MLIRGCLPARDAAAAKDEAEVATATAAVDKLSRPSTLHFGGLALTLYLAQLEHVCPSLSPLVWRLVCSLPTCLAFDLLPPPLLSSFVVICVCCLFSSISSSSSRQTGRQAALSNIITGRSRQPSLNKQLINCYKFMRRLIDWQLL